MFDEKFSAKYDLTSQRYKSIFYHLCINARKIHRKGIIFDHTIIKKKISQLEKKKNSKEFNWLKKKPEKKTISIKETKTNDKINSLIYELENVRENYETLMKQKGIDKETIDKIGKRIQKLEKNIKSKIPPQATGVSINNQK